MLEFQLEYIGTKTPPTVLCEYNTAFRLAVKQCLHWLLRCRCMRCSLKRRICHLSFPPYPPFPPPFSALPTLSVCLELPELYKEQEELPELYREQKELPLYREQKEIPLYREQKELPLTSPSPPPWARARPEDTWQVHFSLPPSRPYISLLHTLVLNLLLPSPCFTPHQVILTCGTASKHIFQIKSGPPIAK